MPETSNSRSDELQRMLSSENQFDGELHLPRRSGFTGRETRAGDTAKAGVPTTFPGWPKFAWLKRSKTSTRNCIRNLSLSSMFFMIEKSVLLNPGPMTTLRPRLPKRETGVNTEVSNQRSTLPIIADRPGYVRPKRVGDACDRAVRWLRC